MEKHQKRALARSIVIEAALYSFFAILYILLVLRLLSGWLVSLFDDDLVMYALVGLGLILVQGVFLGGVTSLLVDRLGLGRPR